MRLVLLGPPGAGKGTQAARLAARYRIPLIGTGDILRRNAEEGTELGRKARPLMSAGKLVPDELVVSMVVAALEASPSRFILDGFPRSVPQAETLEAELGNRGRALTAVLSLVIDDDLVVKRLAGRRVCSRCQRTFNVAVSPPMVDGVCDVCGGELIQRDDDREETVRHRLEVYRRETEPLIGFYAERDLLREVDAAGTEDEVFDRVVSALGEPATV